MTGAQLPNYCKNSDFQARPSHSVLASLLRQTGIPVPGSLPQNALDNLTQAGTAVAGSPPQAETPQTGVLIAREPPFEVPQIYGDTRAEAMWGAGYATAEDRHFFMDVLRHTAEGTTAELLGPRAVTKDSAQLGVQDASPQELTAERIRCPTMGAEGAQSLSDINQYVAGINAFIDLTRVHLARWRRPGSDSASALSSGVP